MIGLLLNLYEAENIAIQFSVVIQG